MINVLRSVLDIKFGHFIFSSGGGFCCVISISVQPADFNFLEDYKVQPGLEEGEDTCELFIRGEDSKTIITIVPDYLQCQIG